MSDSKEFISQVTPNIFATILDLEVFEQGEQEMEKGSKYVTASVQINGTWNGVVTLSIPDGLSRECAAIRFDVASDEATEEDIEEAMGELANMTGGSFKSLIDGTCELGLPAVRGGTCLVMEGPQFSTKAESELYRGWGCDVIGMTNMPEAKLAREAELYAGER